MKPTYEDIKQLFGELDDHTIVEIESSGATVPELEEVAAYLAQETEVMGDLAKPLTGRALEVYTLLRDLEARGEEDR